MEKRINMVGMILLALTFCIPVLQAQVVIPFAEGVKAKKEIPLSTVASSVKYIPLETTPDNLLNGRAIHLDVVFAGKYLFVCDGFHIYQFTPEGKYIRKIGQRGQGPGDFYKHILDVVYDEAKEHIIATDYIAGRAIVFSFKGDYLYNFKIHGNGKIKTFLKPDLLYGFTDSYLYSKDRTGIDLFLMNDQGKMLKKFRFNYIEGKRYPRIIADGLFYTYQDRVYYKNPFENRIFRIEEKKKIPAYDLDLGEYTKYEKDDPQKIVMDKEKGIGTVLATEAGKKRFFFMNLFETDAHLYVRYYQGEMLYLGVYDKQAKEVYSPYSPKMKEAGFVDDLEGGLPFMPIQGKGKVLINMISADKLLEKVQSAEAKGSLREVIDNLVEDDNPILQVVHLK